MVNKVGRTRVESWHVSKLTAAFSSAYEGKTRLEMPPFQRGVVWSPTKQAELVRSLKIGFPIGSLLFYKKAPDQTGVEVNLLIDGLQRTTAVRDYTRSPLAFMTLDDVQSHVVRNLESAFLQAAGERELRGDIDEVIAQWMLKTRTLEPSDGFDLYGLVNTLNSTLCPDDPVHPDESLAKAIHTFLKAVSTECDISTIEIPVLFYEGSDADLPDIFERINATGTKLSKYEIFAASWVNQDIVITNARVLEAIRRRYYALMTSENISVNGVKADGTPERLSLFDYLFGLGKLLTDDYPLLFGGNDDPTAMESVGFALATVCHRLPLSQMHQLPKVMDRDAADRIVPTEFESALLESAQYVVDVLSPFIGLKLNSESANSSGLHTDLQIASMVARVFSGRYVPGTWEERDGAEADRVTLRTSLPQHYLVDVLQQNWRGSGDHRLYQMVWDSTEGEGPAEKVLLPSRHYLRPFGSGEFDRILDQWFGEQVQLNQRSRSYVTAQARAFLKYIYSDIVTVNAENKQTFELDHIFPVSRLVERAKADEDGWPISAVANLALFDWLTNREKSKMDLMQYLARVEPGERDKKRAAVSKYLFLSPESATIPTDQVGNDALSREQYLGFLATRFKKMKSLAFDTLGIERPIQPEGGAEQR